jgi:hypothetical protein
MITEKFEKIISKYPIEVNGEDVYKKVTIIYLTIIRKIDQVTKTYRARFVQEEDDRSLKCVYCDTKFEDLLGSDTEGPLTKYAQSTLPEIQKSGKGRDNETVTLTSNVHLKNWKRRVLHPIGAICS